MDKVREERRRSEVTVACRVMSCRRWRGERGEVGGGERGGERT